MHVWKNARVGTGVSPVQASAASRIYRVELQLSRYPSIHSLIRSRRSSLASKRTPKVLLAVFRQLTVLRTQIRGRVSKAKDISTAWPGVTASEPRRDIPPELISRLVAAKRRLSAVTTATSVITGIRT